MRLNGVEPERIGRTQGRGARAADFPIHKC
jgi:hypothetical protein